jgi:hypothetical protein
VKLTQKIWDDFNSTDDAISKKAARQGDSKMKAYWAHVGKILPRHRVKAQSFFKKVRLHDASVLSITIGELLTFSKTLHYPKSNSVVIKVLDTELNNIYILRYSWIRTCAIKYNGDQRYREKIYYNFGSWSDDKLSLTNDKWLKHKISLDSGASITLEFRHFTYKIEHFKNEKEMLRIVKQITSCTI